MIFHDQQLFHIYNQGNNKRQTFFTEDNYRHFLWQMRAYLFPFGEIVAWCLMPNHFHWLFYVNQQSILKSKFRAHLDETEFLRR